MKHLAQAHGPQSTQRSRLLLSGVSLLSLSCGMVAVTPPRQAAAQTISASSGSPAAADGTGMTVESGVTLSGYRGITEASGITANTITNDGTLLNNSDSSVLLQGPVTTFTNNGAISGDSGISAGANMSAFVNNGTLSASVNGFIPFDDAQVAEIDNNAGATITATYHAIFAGDSDGQTLINAGYIHGNQTAIAAGGTIITLGNSGTLSGGDALNNGGDIESADNSGTIAGTSVAVNNSGTFGAFTNELDITGTTTAINNTGSIASLGNTGTISGGLTGIDNTGSYGTINNNGGTILGSADYGIENGAPGTITSLINLSGSTLDGGLQGVLNEGQITTLSNSGTIESTLTNQNTTFSEDAFGIGNGATGTISLLENNAGGAIGGSSSGIANEGSINSLVNNGSIGGAFTGLYNEGGTITLLSNSGTIEGLGDAGISNYGSINSINNTGLISGQSTGIFTQTSDTIGTLTNSGTISGTVYGGIENLGSITSLDNSGEIGGNTTGLQNSYGSIGILTNSGTISGGSTGIYNDNGTITSLHNSGTITGPTYGVENYGELDTLVNSGTISASDEDAIYNESGTIAQLTNQSGGTLAGGTAGIYNEALIITLSNAGSISGGSGIDNSSDGTITAFSNSGVINGIDDAGIDNDTGTFGQLVNLADGAISGVGSAIFNDGQIGTLTNDGTLSGHDAIFNEYYIGTLSNAGLLSGSQFFGIQNTSYGTITSLTNVSGGTISADSIGFYNDGTIGALDNAGLITATASIGTGDYYNDSLGFWNQYDGTISTFTNELTGTISGATSGLYNQGSIDNFTNNGAITGQFDGIQNSGTMTTFDNAGLISGAETGLSNPGSISNLTNSGTITGPQNGITTYGTIDTLINTGLIAAPGAGGNGVFANGTIVLLDNSGTISGGFYGAGTDEEIGTLFNSGMITGGVTGFYDEVAASTLSNTGIITGGDAGILSYATISVINNSGTIAGTSAAGDGRYGDTVAGIINGYGLAAIDALTNTSTGLITGGSSGIYNLGTITALINNGAITGGSSGIDNENAITTLTSTGTISGGSTGIDNEGGTIGALSNSGLISGGTGNGLINTYNRGNNTRPGYMASVVNNEGGTISGGINGIENADLIIALTNNGVIAGAAGDGILNAAGTSQTGVTATIGALVNSGTITGGLVGVDNEGFIGGIVNSGTITGGGDGLITADDSVTNSGLISAGAGTGHAGLVLGGAGALTNYAGGTISGPTGLIITGNSVTVLDAGSIISTDGGDAIAVEPAVDPAEITLTTGATITGGIDGGGTDGVITLEGTGALPNTISNFGAGSELNVNTGADWTGSGNWTIATVTNSGTFQPGIIGTPLTLTGNFVQATLGTLRVLVTPTLTSQFVIKGAAMLAGTLEYEFAPGTYSPKSYDVLSASAGVTGGFANVTYNGGVPAALAHATKLTTADGNLLLTGETTGGGGGTGGGGAPVVVTPQDEGLFSAQSQAITQIAQQATGMLLDQAVSGNAPASTCAAATQLAPAVTQPAAGTAGQMASIAANAFCNAGGWVTASGGVLNGNAGNYEADTAGFMAGIDKAVDPAGTRLGLAVGYDQTNLHDNGGGKGSAGVTRLGLYAVQPLGGVTLAGTLLYGYATNTTTRPDGVFGLRESHGLSLFSGAVQASAPFSLQGGVTVTPEAGLRITALDGGGFEETGAGFGAAFAVSGHSPSYTSVQPYVNAGASRTFVTASQLVVVPTLSAGIQVEAGDRGRSSGIRAADGTAFTTPSNRFDGTAALVAAGISVGRGAWSAYAGYNATIAGNWTSQTGEAGLRVTF